jgi:hypothetical protein
MNTIFVKGAAGLKLPMEGAPRRYITEAEPVAVEASHYYRKAIADGDLVELSEQEWAAYQADREKAAGADATATVATAAKTSKQIAAAA